MKSIFRKGLSLLLGITLILAVGTAVFAAGNGSITVNNTTAGKLYEIYRIFDLTQSGDAVAYTIDADWEGFFFDAEGKTDAGAAYLYDEQPSGGSLSPISHQGNTYYINITEENVAAFATLAQGYTKDLSPDYAQTAAGASVVFGGIELGYYLVLPVDATEIETGYGSICSLTNAAPDGEINVKGKYPEIEKTVDDPDVEIGQTLTWTITGIVPDTTGYETFTYRVRDTMSAGLTFGDSIASTGFSVTFGDTVIIDDTHAVAATDTLSFSDNGFVLSFDMTAYQQYKGQTITVTYHTTVNDAAVCNLTENTAQLDYGRDPDALEEGTPVEVQVYSSRIVVDKYAADHPDQKLEGAKFALYRLSGESKLYYKYTAATETAPALVEWVADPDDATVLTTDANGAATFVGLESGEYFLQETEAPEGYNLLTSDVSVTVTAPAVNPETQKPIGVSVTAEVANNTGSILPETGGIGTTIFSIVGAILLIGASVVLIVKKRTKDEK